MQPYPEHIPVVVVGAGPTGLTVASLLASYGVDCVVLERESAPLNLPRAIVLDDEGARTLQAIGLQHSYVDQTSASEGAKYYDQDGTCFATVGAGPRNFGFAKKNYILQPELESALRKQLEDRAPGALRFEAEVTQIDQRPDGAVVTVTDRSGAAHQIDTRWVLACDGGRSPIRERLGLAMAGDTYAEDWIVVDTLDDPDTTLFSKFFCNPERPAVSIPAPGGGRRYEFMVLPGETRAAVLEDAFLAELLAPHRVYDTAKVLRKTVYTFHARLVERFCEGRVVLLGDAAHLTPPFAGQGMNAGLRDTHNVAWKVAANLRGGAAPAVLDTYETERRDAAWGMIQLAVAMGDIVMPIAPDQLRFRDLLLSALAPFPAVLDYLVEMRFKPKPEYKDGLFLDLDAPQFEAALPGAMIPQPEVGREGQWQLLDTLMGPGFALIGQGPEAAAALDRLGRHDLMGLPLACVQLDLSPSPAPGADTTRDPAISRPLRTHRDQILLIRPDRYCAAACAPEDLDHMLVRYEALLTDGPTE
ncbi:MAG: bifunctional 3-(3-hydroxy-phenyl)propionate/3-hydroxycinnamic acid hydroxylase [Pseudomonadota bacterium]